jgi:hypothetical protein
MNTGDLNAGDADVGITSVDKRMGVVSCDDTWETHHVPRLERGPGVGS